MSTGKRKGSRSSKRRASRSGSFHRGTYRSTKTGIHEEFDSSYELRRFKALDASELVKSWTKKHGLELHYKLRGRRHRYLPDILVEYKDGRIFLEEIKGRIWDHIAFGVKNLTAASYCFNRGMRYRIIFREQLELVD